jgi:arylsulfatase
VSSSDGRPNVLCFVTDQLRYDHLGCTGNSEIRTPNIDALAERGVLLDRSYVNSPVCMPARSTWFTGRMPRDHGVRMNGVPLDEDTPVLPEMMRESGYRTHSAGKLHLSLYSLPIEYKAYLIKKGELSFDDFPQRWHKVLKPAVEELEMSNYEDLDLDAELFPEAKELWLTGLIEESKEPYFGFESVDLTSNHTDQLVGDYRNWLEENHPEVADRFPRSHPDNEPGRTPQVFDWSLPEEVHYNRWIADRSREFLEEQAGADDPFFLWCSFPDPHHPYGAPEPWGSMYDPEEVSLPTRREGELDDLPPFYTDAYEDEETELSGLHTATKTEVGEDDIREIIATTYGMVSFVDNEVGRVMETLEETGLREDTVVVFLSDHGDMMGDHWILRKGPFHFDGLLRVPQIWSWPGEFPEGERTDGLTSQIDLTPTLLDLCDVSLPDELRSLPEGREQSIPPRSLREEPSVFAGTSLRPQLEGATESVNDHVIVENDEDYLGLRIRSYITDRYKLTIYPGEDYGELFDLAEDPDELHNLWDDPAYEDVKNRLYREFLEDYILEDSAFPPRLSHS